MGLSSWCAQPFPPLALSSLSPPVAIGGSQPRHDAPRRTLSTALQRKQRSGSHLICATPAMTSSAPFLDGSHRPPPLLPVPSAKDALLSETVRRIATLHGFTIHTPLSSATGDKAFAASTNAKLASLEQTLRQMCALFLGAGDPRQIQRQGSIVSSRGVIALPSSLDGDVGDGDEPLPHSHDNTTRPERDNRPWFAAYLQQVGRWLEATGRGGGAVALGAPTEGSDEADAAALMSAKLLLVAARICVAAPSNRREAAIEAVTSALRAASALPSDRKRIKQFAAAAVQTAVLTFVASAKQPCVDSFSVDDPLHWRDAVPPEVIDVFVPSPRSGGGAPSHSALAALTQSHEPKLGGPARRLEVPGDDPAVGATQSIVLLATDLCDAVSDILGGSPVPLRCAGLVWVVDIIAEWSFGADAADDVPLGTTAAAAVRPSCSEPPTPVKRLHENFVSLWLLVLRTATAANTLSANGERVAVIADAFWTLFSEWHRPDGPAVAPLTPAVYVASSVMTIPWASTGRLARCPSPSSRCEPEPGADALTAAGPATGALVAAPSPSRSSVVVLTARRRSTATGRLLTVLNDASGSPSSVSPTAAYHSAVRLWLRQCNSTHDACSARVRDATTTGKGRPTRDRSLALLVTLLRAAMEMDDERTLRQLLASVGVTNDQSRTNAVGQTAPATLPPLVDCIWSIANVSQRVHLARALLDIASTVLMRDAASWSASIARVVLQGTVEGVFRFRFADAPKPLSSAPKSTRLASASSRSTQVTHSGGDKPAVTPPPLLTAAEHVHANAVLRVMTNHQDLAADFMTSAWRLTWLALQSGEEFGATLSTFRALWRCTEAGLPNGLSFLPVSLLEGIFVAARSVGDDETAVLASSLVFRRRSLHGDDPVHEYVLLNVEPSPATSASTSSSRGALLASPIVVAGGAVDAIRQRLRTRRAVKTVAFRPGGTRRNEQNAAADRPPPTHPRTRVALTTETDATMAPGDAAEAIVHPAPCGTLPPRSASGKVAGSPSDVRMARTMIQLLPSGAFVLEPQHRAFALWQGSRSRRTVGGGS